MTYNVSGGTLNLTHLNSAMTSTTTATYHGLTASWNSSRQCQYGNGWELSTALLRIRVASWTRL